MNANSDIHVGVIGAGIIGACCAAELVTRGFRVTLFEPSAPGTRGPSRGNAAHIATPEVIPLASPGIVSKALAMLFDPDAPLKIPLSQWLRLLPWLWSFVGNSRPTAFAQNIQRLADINAEVWQDTEALYEKVGLRHMLSKSGALYLHESEQSFQAAKAAWAHRAAAGYEFEELDAEQIQAIEPALSHQFVRARKVPTWGVVSDPRAVTQGIVEFALQNGAAFEAKAVANIDAMGPWMRLITQCGDRVALDRVVLCAGIWSKELMAPEDQPRQLEAERGYNLTYQNAQVSINHPLVFSDRGIVATQMNDGLRVGGWAELGGLTRPPQSGYFNRIDRIAQQLFPTLNSEPHYRWMGHRPSTPNSLPILRRAKRHPGIIYACGHGHLGLTQAPTTAKRVADMLQVGS